MSYTVLEEALLTGRRRKTRESRNDLPTLRPLL